MKSRKKRVLHLLSSNKFSGAENVACTIISMFREEYDMVYCCPIGPIKMNLQEKSIFYYPLEKMSYKNIKSVIKQYKPDIIYAHDFRASCYASLFKNKKCKVISHIHGNNSLMRKLNFKTILYYFLSKNFSKIIWVSNSSFDEFYFREKIKGKSIVLYNIIDEEEIKRKSELYSYKEEFDLVFLGRIAYPKNPERLINIMNLLKKNKNNIKLAIIGEGEQRKKIEDMASQSNLNDNIVFFGYQNNPFPILKKSKMMIMTSLYEGTPMASLEAQCLGLPIVSTPVDGLVDIIENDYNGFLSNDDIKIAEKILSLLKDKKKLKSMSENSIKKFKSINNIDIYKKNILELLK